MISPIGASKPEHNSVHHVTVVLFFLALLVGRFSLNSTATTHVWESTSSLLEIRYWAFAVLALVVFAVRTVDRQSAPGSPLPRGWLLAFFLFCCYLAFSVSWAQRLPDVGRLLPVLDVLLLSGYTLVAAYLFSLDRDRNFAFLMRLFYGASLLYLLGGLAGIGRPDPTRLSAFSGGPNVFVRIMAAGVIAGIYLYLKEGDQRWLIGVPFLLIGAVLSGSRGGILALAITAPFAAAVVFRRGGSKRVGRGLVGLTLAAAVSQIIFGHSVSEYVQQRFVQTTFVQKYSAERNTISEAAWGLFQDHKAYGAGLTGFFVEQGAEHGWEYPHELFLAIASESGLLGLGLCLGALVLLFRGTRRRRATLDTSIAGVLGLYYLIASQFSGSYIDSRWVWVFLTIFALAAPGESLQSPDARGVEASALDVAAARPQARAVIASMRYPGESVAPL